MALPRMRTAKAAAEELKKIDPNTAFANVTFGI